MNKNNLHIVEIKQTSKRVLTVKCSIFLVPVLYMRVVNP